MATTGHGAIALLWAQAQDLRHGLQPRVRTRRRSTQFAFPMELPNRTDADVAPLSPHEATSGPEQ